MEPPSRQSAFTIRWDDSMGCYRVSVPRLNAATVVRVEDVLHWLRQEVGYCTNADAELMAQQFEEDFSAAP